MKNCLALTLLAIAIGCAAKGSSRPASPAVAPASSSAEPGMMGAPTTARTEIDRLDQAISAEMATLSLARPAAPPLSCTGDECVQQLSNVAIAATAAEPATCRPAATPTCTDSCKLKSSICDNAGRICKLASELGGNDAYANDKCSSGNASCEAARQRCCSCL